MKSRMLSWLAAVILIGVSTLIATSPTSSSAMITDQTSPSIETAPPSAPDVPSCVYTGPMWARWTLNAPMPTARHSFATIASAGQSVVYAIGGLQGWTDALAANERFNACSNTWQSLAPLPAPRGYIQAAELNSKLYVVGGVDHVVSGTFGVQNTVWVYEPSINFWHNAADLPRALGGVAVATANGKLYAFGGFDSRGPGAGDVDTVYEYDPGRDRWSLRSTLPGGARSLAGAAELNGEIYVVGGVSGSLSGLGRNEVYNPTARTWRTAHSIGDGFYGFSLFKTPDGYLYALGGSHFNNDSWFASYRYDPGADGWSGISDLQINDGYNHGLSSGTYAAGRVFLVGGEGSLDGRISNVNESARVLESWCESSIQATPQSVAPGDRITYTIVLHGEVNPLPNVILLDPIPGGTTFDGFIDNPAGATYNASGNQVEWHGALPANPTPITITFSVRVSTGGWTNGQFLTNTVAIHNGLNVIERSAGTWIDAFDLSMSSKRVNRESAVVGDVMTYTIRVQSGSPTSGTAALIDPIPPNTTYISGSLISTLGTASYADGRIEWNGQLIGHTAVYTNTSSDYQWGDSHGNGVVPGVKYDWIEIKDTGERYQFNQPDNDGCYHTAFPFDFTYYTTVYTKAAVSTNGTLYFIDDWHGVTYPMSPDNSPLPGSNFYHGYSFGRFIAPFWDDLYMTPGKIYHQVFGVAPNRKVVIEFGDVTRRDGSTKPGEPGSFEMIVFEGSSAIQFQYKDVDFGNPAFNNGASASIGMQNYEEGLQYSYNTPSISDRLAILIVPPHHSITYTANFADIIFAVTPNAVLPDRRPITNTATISSSVRQVITRETTMLYGVPNFAGSYKTVDRSSVQPNDTLMYEIHVVNSGPVDGLLQLTDVLPNSLYEWQSSLTYPFGSGHERNDGIDWTGTVPAMSSATIRFGAYVNSDVAHGQSIVNTATLTDVVTGLIDHPSATVTISKPADLYLISIGPGAIEPTAPLTYALDIGNLGPFDTEEPVVVIDELPDGVTFVDASAGGVYSPTTNIVTWQSSSLTVAATRTLTVTVMPPGAPLGTVLTNSVSIGVGTQDPSLADNTHQWFTRVGVAPNLLNGTAKLIDPASAGRGDVVTYTMLIHNTGSTTATTTITDPIPSGTSYQAGSSTVDGNAIELFDAASNQIRWTGSIAPDDDRVVRFRALVDRYAIVTNTVTIDDGTGLIFNRSVAMRPTGGDVFLPLILR